jgi:hypothetical protein
VDRGGNGIQDDGRAVSRDTMDDLTRGAQPLAVGRRARRVPAAGTDKSKSYYDKPLAEAGG